ncbi:MAG: SH3 domain-containing protein [Lachnospiraceae bacterium]|nr:SH3 domain-containing protein [Lachnospiraceae bacterium]
MKKRMLILSVIIVLAVAVFVSGMLVYHKNDVEEAVTEQETEVAENAEEELVTEAAVAAVSVENPLEADKYPEINELIEKYLNALADGDVDTMVEICSNVTDTEKIRIQELGEYIETFPEYNVFTKLGPVENSYVVYAAARAQFPGLETLIPGIYCLYVCMDEDGSYYINEDTLTDEETAYIDALNSDESVINLLNSIDEEYQEMVENDSEIATYLEVMVNQIRDAVGTALASVSDGEDSEDGSSEDSESSDETIVAKSCKATTTETINVRSSDSTAADKLGTIQKGTTLDVIEIRVNGWAKIEYQGQEAYVKTDYLTIISSADDEPTNGYVVANTTVNVRASASADADKLGQVTEGEALEWIEDVTGGFSKVKYNGSIGYVATEYVTKQE